MLAYNGVIGGNGGNGGSGGVGGKGGDGGRGGLVAASITATNTFTYNDGGAGGSLTGLASKAQIGDGKPGRAEWEGMAARVELAARAELAGMVLPAATVDRPPAVESTSRPAGLSRP